MQLTKLIVNYAFKIIWDVSVFVSVLCAQDLCNVHYTHYDALHFCEVWLKFLRYQQSYRLWQGLMDKFVVRQTDKQYSSYMIPFWVIKIIAKLS